MGLGGFGGFKESQESHLGGTECWLLGHDRHTLFGYAASVAPVVIHSNAMTRFVGLSAILQDNLRSFMSIGCDL